MFDFSKSQYDSAFLVTKDNTFLSTCNTQIFNVDSVYNSLVSNIQVSLSNPVRKTWIFNPINNVYIKSCYLYEGIGPSFGLFGKPDPSFEGNSSRHESYCVGSDSVCGKGYVFTEISEVSERNTIAIFPNPFSNLLAFSFSGNDEPVFTLFDFLGRKILEQTLKNNTSVITQHFANGIYFYELSSAQGVIKSGKLIKQ